ncbi:YwiC-like family protein [Aneurinibacillus aneurinilyticus]|uniref:YwiC-like family protein n=1 Tax=Aneurinibacillus aneurinilyticus TaxID=1391 RepID=UPI0023F0B7B8|nr:YwiC-like family protein [Aneurinibacillus aneurinilyticus]
MRLLIPKQHGAWAMLIVPFWLGVMASTFYFGHLFLFIGWLFLYLASYAALMLAKGRQANLYKKWTTIYLSLAGLFIFIPVWQQPKLIGFGLLLLPFFAVSAYYSAKNCDRALTNDMSAIFIFSSSGAASYFYGANQLDKIGLFLFFICFLFFLGSALYVKTMIREKGNRTYRNVSWGYHGVIVCAWLLFGEWLVCLAFLPSLFRAYAFYGRKLSILQVGIYEIANSVLFFTIVTLALSTVL